ncbi:OmpA family lipoprotein [Cellvibrio zantedeschiae]|uniref:OmpA family lipoprotein n=1 Tax=Cellvibrio zantedeschiae TaxID=1237077 RepID=A0ABQ3ARD0_9GAMM|nr:OmpA family protein [Cellvibrio zantedeschiae]GGY65504.1 OmpA family lipoprotein [Cellvibrio zantedeschiae]
MKKLIVFLSIIAFTGCATVDQQTGEQNPNKTGKGAGIGAIAGAVLGAAVSSKSDRGRGAVTGAVLGAAVGGGVGHYMDKQEKELREKLKDSGVQVNRQGNDLNLIMPGNITFAVGKSDIRSDFYSVLNSVAQALKQYDQTTVRISGFTDSTGPLSFNQRLSEERANSVRTYLLAQGVASERIDSAGYGPANPIASNASEDGRQANRRVEIKLIPIQQ